MTRDEAAVSAAIRQQAKDVRRCADALERIAAAMEAPRAGAKASPLQTIVRVLEEGMPRGG